MGHCNANIDDFAMDSRSLAGPLPARLKAVRDAGFTQIMLSAGDLVAHADGLDAAVAAVRASGLRVAGLQTLRDFEGLSGSLRAHKIDVAKEMMAMCQALGAHLLVAEASAQPQSSEDRPTLVRHLRQLAMLAIPMNIRIAYKAGCGAHVMKAYGPAWDLVCEADMPNLGLCLDVADMLVAGTPQDDLDFLEPEKLFLVQLADAMGQGLTQCQLFPGEGEHSVALARVVTTLHQQGYRGDYGLSVVNVDDLQMPLPHVAQRAWTAALWLGQDVLQRSVPLPNQIRLRHAGVA